MSISIKNLTTTARNYGFVVPASPANGTPGAAVTPTAQQLSELGKNHQRFLADMMSQAILVENI